MKYLSEIVDQKSNLNTFIYLIIALNDNFLANASTALHLHVTKCKM